MRTTITIEITIPYDELQYLKHWGQKEDMTVEEVVEC